MDIKFLGWTCWRAVREKDEEEGVEEKLEVGVYLSDVGYVP